ncbi:hypothetical protein ACGFZK_02400 [Streptomyces sp. NPDC048257]|uniref:hypothetical protein n=1 Tax=Streptomyces sp. NPDC048257 TaxID=3365526 RepID=UPI003721CC87
MNQQTLLPRADPDARVRSPPPVGRRTRQEGRSGQRVPSGSGFPAADRLTAWPPGRLRLRGADRPGPGRRAPTDDGATMLRRGWSYYDGLRSDATPDAGMLFVAWQCDPRAGFVPVQHRLARGDALGRYLVPEASSPFVVPGGIPPGGYVGQALLEDQASVRAMSGNPGAMVGVGATMGR